MLKKHLKEDGGKFNIYIWQAYYNKFMKDHDLFATLDKEHQEKIYSLIEKCAIAKEIYCFAYYIKDANILRLEDAIIKINNAKAIYHFALNIKNANISRLEDALIKTNDAEFIYYFALNIKNVNVSKLEDAIIKTDNAGYIYCFARDIKRANKKRLRQKYDKLKKQDN